MTNYHLTPPTILPSLAVQEAKEKRRRVLEAVRARRKIIYTRFHQKMQAQSQITQAWTRKKRRHKCWTVSAGRAANSPKYLRICVYLELR